MIFPAWHRLLSRADYYEMGEKFEDLECRQFDKDGFEYAVRTIAEIETELGLANPARFTAAAPRGVS